MSRAIVTRICRSHRCIQAKGARTVQAKVLLIILFKAKPIFDFSSLQFCSSASSIPEVSSGDGLQKWISDPGSNLHWINRERHRQLGRVYRETFGPGIQFQVFDTNSPLDAVASAGVVVVAVATASVVIPCDDAVPVAVPSAALLLQAFLCCC